MVEQRRPLDARSFLFVPATRPDRFGKALAAGADAVVIDLEDAVEPGAKQCARDELARWSAVEHPGVVIRINAPRTGQGAADLELLRNLPQRALAAVVIPKVEVPQDVEQVTSAVQAGVPTLPIIETARGLARVADIACTPNIARLICGDFDLALDLGIDFASSGALVAAAKFPIVLASRAAALAPPVDGADADFSQPDRVQESARRARALGFGAKICIHPAQIGPVHSGFAPTHAELTRARQILAAADGGAGVFQIAGRMIDKPVIDWARNILRALPREIDGDIHDAQSC